MPWNGQVITGVNSLVGNSFAAKLILSFVTNEDLFIYPSILFTNAASEAPVERLGKIFQLPLKNT